MGLLVPESTPVPAPVDWTRIHSVLSSAWREKSDPRVPQPPVPLILAGAAFSKASEIRQRWSALIRWANNHGFSEVFLSALPPPPNEDIAEVIAGISESGQGWWPKLGQQHHEPKIRPSGDLVVAMLKKLQANWLDVVGHEIGHYTKPHRFSGSKSRRLVVIADEAFTPPWGSWYFIRHNPQSFTGFRKNVNAAISPLEVDMITFRSANKTKQ